MFRKKSPTIEYWTKVEGLSYIEDARPTPYKNMKPDWWKAMPSNFGGNDLNKTVKMCPSFYDLFANAYVLRMWCDTKITRQSDGMFFWETPDENFIWGGHSKEQMLDYTPAWLKERAWATAKPVSPWLAKTPKGYSIYQLPVMYDFNPHFVALQGVIHSDWYHGLNVPMFLFSEKEHFEIKLGTPLAIHVPFKREKFSATISEENKEYETLRKKSHLVSSVKFKNSYRNVAKNIYKQ